MSVAFDSPPGGMRISHEVEGTPTPLAPPTPPAVAPIAPFEAVVIYAPYAPPPNLQADRAIVRMHRIESRDSAEFKRGLSLIAIAVSVIAASCLFPICGPVGIGIVAGICGMSSIGSGALAYRYHAQVKQLEEEIKALNQ